jgi:type IV pilus assembly protein PilB
VARRKTVRNEDVAPEEGSGRLGDLLVRRRLVTPAQLAEALLQQQDRGKRIGEMLIELGVVGERDLAGVLSDQLQIPLVDLRVEKPEPSALALVPEEVARRLTALPLKEQSGMLDIAIADPRAEAIDELRAVSGNVIRVLLAPSSDIRRVIDKSYHALVGVDRYVETFEQVEASRRPEVTLQEQVTEDAPVVQVVNLMITQALRDRASDVHIEPQGEQVRVRYRIDGALKEVLILPASMSQALVSRIKIMAGMNIVERQRPQDGQIAMKVDGRDIDIRVATSATIWGEKAVLRLLDKSRSVFHLDALGMPQETHDVFSRMIHSPFGMVLCAGPTGSGKTTTLYAALNEINDVERNIMTIEDPVEYVFPSANQIQIREQAGVTFAGGLRGILRQDPDVILVGEIRDTDTARIAVQAALTGHLMLSSVHATDAVSALHRFIDMGIEPFLLSSSIVGVVGQRLVRRICPGCKVRYAPPSEELVFYAESGGDRKTKFWHGEGCNLCAHTGYQDRIGVYELLRVSETLKQMIVAGASRDELQEVAVEQGMRTLRQEGLRLVQQDVTTIAEVLRAIYVL